MTQPREPNGQFGEKLNVGVARRLTDALRAALGHDGTDNGDMEARIAAQQAVLDAVEVVPVEPVEVAAIKADPFAEEVEVAGERVSDLAGVAWALEVDEWKAAELVVTTKVPGASMGLIAEAMDYLADEEKRQYSPELRRKYAKEGIALPDGSYPIPDGGALGDAIQSFGRGNTPKSTVKAHIIKRARALGLVGKLPDDWHVEKAEDIDAEEKVGRWDPRKHPRDEEGEFTSGPGGRVARVGSLAEQQARATAHPPVGPSRSSIPGKEHVQATAVRQGPNPLHPFNDPALEERAAAAMAGESGEALGDVQADKDRAAIAARRIAKQKETEDEEARARANRAGLRSVSEMATRPKPKPKPSGMRSLSEMATRKPRKAFDEAGETKAALLAALDALDRAADGEEEKAEPEEPETTETVEDAEGEPETTETTEEPQAAEEPEAETSETREDPGDPETEAEEAASEEEPAEPEEEKGEGGADRNRGNAGNLRRYWTHGEGAAKIRWGTPGDHMRCVRQLVEHGKFTTDQAHGYCNLREKEATGQYPAQHAEKLGKTITWLDGAVEVKAAELANENPEPDGVMVALYPPDPVAEALAVDGGLDAAELHVTLAYLGRKPDVEGRIDDLVQLVAGFTDDSYDLAGEVNGLGRFSAVEDARDALVALVDAPDLPDFRTDMVDALEDAGFEVRSDHGFSPHMTLAYIEPSASLPLERIEPVPATFGTLSLAYGGDVWDFPLHMSDEGEAPEPRRATESSAAGEGDAAYDKNPAPQS